VSDQTSITLSLDCADRAVDALSLQRVSHEVTAEYLGRQAKLILTAETCQHTSAQELSDRRTSAEPTQVSYEDVLGVVWNERAAYAVALAWVLVSPTLRQQGDVLRFEVTGRENGQPSSTALLKLY
jgi:hypothetical protein